MTNKRNIPCSKVAGVEELVGVGGYSVVSMREHRKSFHNVNILELLSNRTLLCRPRILLIGHRDFKYSDCWVIYPIWRVCC